MPRAKKASEEPKAEKRTGAGAKYETAEELQEKLDAYFAECAERGDTLLGTLPFDAVVTKAMVARKALTEFDNPVGNRLKDMWSALQKLNVRR